MPDDDDHRQVGDEAGGGVIRNGPFDQDIHSTPAVLWVATLLMCAGTTVAGVGVSALGWGSRTTLWVLVGIGAFLAIIGAGVAQANNVMSNVH